MRDITKAKEIYIEKIYREMRRRGYTEPEIPKVLAKTGFIAALDKYTEEQLLCSVEDSVDEIILVAARS